MDQSQNDPEESHNDGNDPVNADMIMEDSGMNNDDNGDFDYEHDGDEEQHGDSKEVLREQDRFLPIANINRIMKRVIPDNGKVAKDAKETCQECVSEFISFITSEASERCQHEKRKTINGEDLLWAMQNLGFDSYVEPLKLFLAKYREANKGGEKNSGQFDGSGKVDPATFLVDASILDSATTTNGGTTISVPVSALLQQLNGGGPQSILIQAGGGGATQQLMMTTANGLQFPTIKSSGQQQMSPGAQQPQFLYFDSSGNLQMASGSSGGQLIMAAPMANQNISAGKSEDQSSSSK